jgi:lipooligosaccharide transport system permease protein
MSAHGLPPISAWNVYSVWRRHAKVYRKTWLVNVLPPLSEPLQYLVAFGLGLSPMVAGMAVAGNKVSYLAYIAPAMVALGVAFQSFFEAAYGSYIRLRFQKTWQALLTAPLSYTEVFLGDMVWAATRGIIAGVVTGLVTVAFGIMPPWGFAGSLPLIVLGSLLFAALGMIVSGIVRTIDHINVPVFVFIMPMFTMSGTFFPRENLPPWLAAYANLLPLSQLNDLMRWHLAETSLWGLKLAVLLAWTIISTGVAWRVIHRQVFK